MALVKPDSARIAKIKVIGVGGGGGNAVASMVDSGLITGVEFIAANTDAQVLLSTSVATKLQIGENSLDLNKIPRWALVAIATIGLISCGTLISTARADLDKFKAIAYQAKNVSDSNTSSIVELKNDVAAVQQTVEIIRKENREDFKDIDKKMSELLRAVNKI